MKFIFDNMQLNELLNNFYTLTKIRIVIFDKSFNKIISVPEYECNFCTTLKKNTKAFERCCQSDREACRICKETGKLHIYKCHTGLIEAVSPLKMNSIHLGYIMLGQIIDKSDKKNKKTDILNYISDLTEMNLSESFDKLTAKRPDQIHAAAKIMEICAYYLWMAEMIKISDDHIVIRLTNYINENLQGDLSVDHLCDYFCISRRQLYNISNNYYGMGIAKFIRKKRIEKAEQLLKANCSVAEAANLAGFYDYNYFSKIFKAETGVLPSKVKEK